jgi:hypothetical protein
VDDKWCPDYLEDVFTSPILDGTSSQYFATEHGIRVVIKRQRIRFEHNGELVATGEWMTDSYAMDIRVIVPREPAKINIATASKSLQLWNERLIHQDKRHAQKVLERMEINMSMAET